MPAPVRPRMSRESRLLAATIGVSLLVLFLLARLRFPAATDQGRDVGAAQPLSRLAARAAFDDLSRVISELSSRVEGSLLVLRVSGPPANAGEHAPVAAGGRVVPALRVRDDVALTLVPEGTRIDGLVGVPGATTTVASDPTRGLVLVRVSTQPAPVVAVREGAQPLAVPGYLAVSEASPGGASLRPVFVGRSDAVPDPRWDAPLLTLGRGAAGDVGAAVFTLDGRLAGLVTLTDGAPALVPAQVVMAMVDQLLQGATPVIGDVGVATQAVGPRLAAATGVSAGAAVAAVATDGPAANALVPGDVITAINGQPITSSDAFRLRVSRGTPDQVLALTVRRGGAFTTVPVTVRARPVAGAGPSAPGDAPAAAVTLGLTLRSIPDVGSEVLRVADGSAASAAGLRAGDVIESLGPTRAPSPPDLVTAYDRLDAAGVLFLSVSRGGQPLLIVIRR